MPRSEPHSSLAYSSDYHSGAERTSATNESGSGSNSEMHSKSARGGSAVDKAVCSGTLWLATGFYLFTCIACTVHGCT